MLEIPKKYDTEIDIMIEAKAKEQAILKLYKKYPRLNCKIENVEFVEKVWPHVSKTFMVFSWLSSGIPSHRPPRTVKDLDMFSSADISLYEGSTPSPRQGPSLARPSEPK